MRYLQAAALAVTLVSATAPTVTADDGPTFQNGFQDLAAHAPNLVGEALEDEHGTDGGNVEQATTTGLLLWKPGLPPQWMSNDSLDHGAWIPGRGWVTWTSESPVPPPAPVVPPVGGYGLRVRLTYYVLSGRMANGRSVHAGAAACSSNIPMGSTVVFPGGERVVCEDTGRLGSSGWIDVWQGQAFSRRYGDYVTVRIQ